jgi:hypothetical protein
VLRPTPGALRSCCDNEPARPLAAGPWVRYGQMPETVTLQYIESPS